MKNKNNLQDQKKLSTVKTQKTNKQSFWKYLCPCFCSNNKDGNNSQKQKSNELRQQFYQQNTNNEDNPHEQTQASLPMNFGGSQFNNKNNQEIINKLKYIKNNQINQREAQNNPIKFNIKRNNNMVDYLNQNKQNNSRNEGKQNNRPYNQLNKGQRYIDQKNKNRISDDQNQDLKYKKGKGIIQKLNNNRMKINRQQLISIDKKLQKMQGLADYQFLQNWQQTYQNNYPINFLQQNKLIVIGSKFNKLLTKITSVKLFPSASSVQRYKQSIQNKQFNLKYNKKNAQSHPTLDRYWDKRYFLFQRFDQGIQLDQQSWFSVTPQAVADYISSKINVKNTILDGFCGAGGDAIKLATSCNQLIANDIDQKKLKCLLNNAKIYDANNITISCSDFFKLKCKADAVYLAPPWGGPDYFKIPSFNPEQFSPKLSLIVQKALTLSSNLVFLLPANTDMEALAAIISQKIRSVKGLVPESCALKIQKIYFNERLKFLLCFFGNSQVQNDIKLGQQLSFIYTLLRENNDEIFKHKKLIRKIRQEYGMVNLLNYTFECQKFCLQRNEQFVQTPMVQRFQKFLLQKNLIDLKSLQKIKQQQEMQYEYELKNRQAKNKKQKNKRIQKHKQKQQRRQLSLNNQIKNEQKIEIQLNQCPQNLIDSQNQQIPISQIINEANKNNKNVLIQSVESNIQSHQGINQSLEQPIRDSLRTVSLVSQFHQDQLNNMGRYERITTNSDYSRKDSIHPIQKYDELDISIDASSRVSQESGQFIPYSGLNKYQPMSQRLSQPVMVSPRQPIKMTKTKVGNKWQRGVIQQENERDS